MATMTTENEDLISIISETLSQTESWIGLVLNSVGWTEEHILKTEEKLPCPNNQNHIIPKSRMESHLQYCPLLKDGYTREELENEREKSSKFFYEKADDVISMNLDDETIDSVIHGHLPGQSLIGQDPQGSIQRPVPATVDRMMLDLSADQKLRLYEFCVQTAKATKKRKVISDEDLQLLEKTDKDEDRPMSFAERRAAERDMKRRRQSYRNKGVHTANKSYSEVIREVIEQQSELLADKWRSTSRHRERASERRHEHRVKDEKSDSPSRYKASSRDDKADDREDSDHDRKAHKKHKRRKSRSPSPEVSDGDSHSSSRHKKHKKHKHKKHKSKGRDE